MRNKYILFLICGVLSFSSCVDEEQPAVQRGGEVSLDFPVSVAAMQAAGNGPHTRSAMSAEEKAIHSLYVVQFDGTAATSTAVKAGEATVPDAAGKAGYGFTATAGDCRVYVIANVTPSVTVGATTLGDFEKMMAAYTPTVASVASTGLPMCNCVDFNPSTVTTAPAITLRAMVAKLVVKYTVADANLFEAGVAPTITLKNVPTGTAFGAPANANTAYRPTGVGYSDIVVGPTGETTYTYYVPENIAGIGASATTWRKRTPGNAPADALYLEITGRTATGQDIARIISFIGDPSEPTKFNILRNTCYTLTATVNDLNTTDERITVIPDDLSASATANCYIVTVPGTFHFDATKPGNNSTVSGITKPTNLTTAVEARVLWQTGATVGVANAVVKSVEYDKISRIVKFTTGSATEGNAVIGIFASSDDNAPCLWSWHIWRLPSAPGTKTFNKTSATTGGTVAVTMMDRNLGAYNNNTNDVKAIGLFYQWGRKDPFPGPAGFNDTEPGNIYGSLYAGGAVKTFNGAYTIPAVENDATTGTINYAIQYPGAFIYQGLGNDWLQTKDNNLWGTPWQDGGTGSYNKNQGTKSIYDPCPPGYRVPPQDTWSLQTTAGAWSNGMTMDKLGNFWFPAAGLRWGDYDAGKLGGVGCGYCWSSSPYDGEFVDASYLDFGGGYINARNSFCRAHACSVRCVSE